MIKLQNDSILSKKHRSEVHSELDLEFRSELWPELRSELDSELLLERQSALPIAIRTAFKEAQDETMAR